MKINLFGKQFVTTNLIRLKEIAVHTKGTIPFRPGVFSNKKRAIRFNGSDYGLASMQKRIGTCQPAYQAA